MGSIEKEREERSKFFTVNIKKLNSLIDTLGSNNKYNVNNKDILALLYILRDIEFNTNTITITKMNKIHITQNIGMSESAYNQFITKMKKLEVFVDKKKNDVYILNDELINFGDNTWEAGEYIKVSSRGLSKDLERSKVNLSSVEIKIFLYLLSAIHYNDDSLLANTVNISKDVKESLIEKFDISSRTFDNFIKKMKETKLLIKINNTLYKVNNKYFTFGGDLDPISYNEIIKVNWDELEKMKEENNIPDHLKWLFEKKNKGGDKNDK